MMKLVSNEALLIGTIDLIALILSFHIEIQRLQVRTLKIKGTQYILQLLRVQ